MQIYTFCMLFCLVIVDAGQSLCNQYSCEECSCNDRPDLVTASLVTTSSSIIYKITEPMKRIFNLIPRLLKLLEAEITKVEKVFKDAKTTEADYREAMWEIALQEKYKLFDGDELLKHSSYFKNFFYYCKRKAPVDPKLVEVLTKILTILCDHKDDEHFITEIEIYQKFVKKECGN